MPRKNLIQHFFLWCATHIVIKLLVSNFEQKSATTKKTTTTIQNAIFITLFPFDDNENCAVFKMHAMIPDN